MLEQFKDRLREKVVIKKIGCFYYFDNFMISEIDEGVEITFELVFKVTEKYTKKHFGTETPFVFITNRINSYSLDPTIHLKTKRLLPNTKGFAAITYNPINEDIAALEQLFLSIPSEIFDNLEDAIAWADSIIASGGIHDHQNKP